MNEGRTTAIFAVVAAVSFGLALWSRPGAITNMAEEAEGVAGTSLFEKKFEDPSEAATLEIVKYDEELARLERFSVVKDSDTSLWRLPSYDDYPADASDQVRDATTPLIGLEVLDVVSTDRGDHSLYGVVNPDDEDLSVAESGVGMLVRVKGSSDDVLASLVVGKEVEKTEGQRYVRIPSQDAVYQVELSTEAFTTDFQKWINSKLLDVRSFDITAISLRDYAVLPLQNGSYGISRKYDADVKFNADSSKWDLNRFVVYEGNKGVDTELQPGEQLQDSAINDLRNAVQDLEIVGVRRKPDGLAADLKADKSLAENEESMKSLLEQGFFLQETARGVEMVATGGETIFGTDDGVQYLLRFGEASAGLGTTDDEEEGESGLRRFLLVTAQLDESKFPPPELEVQPETVEDMLKMRGEGVQEQATEVPSEEPAQQPAAETPAVSDETEMPSSQTEEPNSDGGKAEESGKSEESGVKADGDAKPEGGKNDPANEPAKEESSNVTNENATKESDGKKEAGQSTESADKPAGESSEAATENSKEEATNSADPDGTSVDSEADLNDCGPQEEADESEADGSQDADNPQEGDSAAPADPQEAPADASEPTREELEEELQAVRESINKANQRKIDERNEKIDDARRKVQELNARFSEWYYVVSDSVYTKLKLSREQLIKAEAAPAAGGIPGLPGGIPGLNGAPPGGGLPPGSQLPPAPSK